MDKTECKKCKLCGIELNAKNKRRSHALTKASFFDQMPLKSGEHLSIITVGGSEIDDAGHHTWEYAFCDNCELKFSRWEGERERFLSSAERPTMSYNEQNFVEVAGFNQEYIELACLTDLYRCSVFIDKLYRKVSLGEEHGAKVSDILRKGELNSFTEYPVVLWRYNNKEEVIDGVFQLPQKARFKDGIRIYEVLAPRGWSWMIKVDSRPCELFEKVALGSSQNIRIVNAGSIFDSQNRRTLAGLVKAALQINNG